MAKRKANRLLGALLALQLLLAWWVFSVGDDLSAQPPSAALLAFEPAQITSIRIAGAPGEELVLDKSDAAWVLPTAWNAPADASQVEQFLQRLHGLQQGLPVAGTAGARQRFEVAEEKFQRHVTLLAAGEPVASVYFGTSPGLRKVHARNAGADRVYAVSFAIYEAPDQADDWLDKALLRIGENELRAIEFDGLSLTRAAGEEASGSAPWQLLGADAGADLQQDKATALAAAVARLQVRKVLGDADQPVYQQAAPRLRLRLRGADADAIDWTLSKPEQGESYVLKSSQYPWYFEVSDWSAQALLEAATRQALLAAPSVEPASVEPESEPAALQ
jgi:hypothetical protein